MVLVERRGIGSKHVFPATWHLRSPLETIVGPNALADPIRGR